MVCVTAKLHVCAQFNSQVSFPFFTAALLHAIHCEGNYVKLWIYASLHKTTVWVE